MRAKRKYQTSQNSYFSMFLFTDLKLSNLKKKDAGCGILTTDLLFMLVWCTLVASRLHYGTLNLYATFKIRSVMIYQINIILLLYIGALAQEAPLQRKMGNPSSRENLVMKIWSFVRTDSWERGGAFKCHLRFRVFSIKTFHILLEVALTSK